MYLSTSKPLLVTEGPWEQGCQVGSAGARFEKSGSMENRLAPKK